jgi:hypothetical protein
MTQDATPTRRRLEIDWIRSIAGALAAVVSAVVLSTLGAAGTLIGAAIGSLVATVGGAMFAQGLSTSSRKLADAQSMAIRKIGVAQAEVRRAGRADDTGVQESHLEHADAQLADAKQKLDGAAIEAGGQGASIGWRDRLAGLPWRRIGLTSLILFVVAVVAITAFELIAGRSVSSLTGGSDGNTTIGQVTRNDGRSGDDHHRPRQTESPSPTTTDSTSPAPDDGESSDAPSETPSDSATPTETASPSQGASESTSPNEEPSTSPTG